MTEQVTKKPTHEGMLLSNGYLYWADAGKHRLNKEFVYMQRLSNDEKAEALCEGSESWTLTVTYKKDAPPLSLLSRILEEFGNDNKSTFLSEFTRESPDNTVSLTMSCQSGRCWDAGARDYFDCHYLCNGFGTCYGPFSGRCT